MDIGQAQKYRSCNDTIFSLSTLFRVGLPNEPDREGGLPVDGHFGWKLPEPTEASNGSNFLGHIFEVCSERTLVSPSENKLQIIWEGCPPLQRAHHPQVPKHCAWMFPLIRWTWQSRKKNTRRTGAWRFRLPASDLVPTGAR